MKQRFLAFSARLLFLVLGFCLSTVATAEALRDPYTKYNPPPEPWHFYLAPYFWMAGQDGYAKIRGAKANMSVPLTEARQQLDFSSAMIAEASKGRWTLIFDPAYVKFSQNIKVNGIDILRAKVSNGTVVMDGGGYYTLLANPEKAATIEVLVAARILSFYTVYHFYDTLIPNRSDTSSVLVPLVGARLKYNFTPKWQCIFNGEFGGFQVDHVSSTWSSMLAINYYFANTVALSLGFRGLGVNYEKQAITLNNTIFGPLFGLAFTF